MIELSQEALQVFKDLELGPTEGVRLAVAGGGCSGLQYKLDVDENQRADDLVSEISGIRFFIDPKSAPFLKGLRLGYVNTLLRQGFTFENPNATKSCGCGKSFCG